MYRRPSPGRRGRRSRQRALASDCLSRRLSPQFVYAFFPPIKLVLLSGLPVKLRSSHVYRTFPSCLSTSVLLLVNSLLIGYLSVSAMGLSRESDSSMFSASLLS